MVEEIGDVLTVADLGTVGCRQLRGLRGDGGLLGSGSPSEKSAYPGTPHFRSGQRDGVRAAFPKFASSRLSCTSPPYDQLATAEQYIFLEEDPGQSQGLRSPD